MNSDTFFTELAAKRRSEQAGQRSAFAIPSGSQVPWALGLAMRHGLLVQPVLAQSRYASASARVGVPDNTREQIEYWAALYRDATACNWELTTGPDSVIGVEIDMRYSDETLRLFPDNVYDDVANTLMWDVGSRRVAVFKYAPDLPRIIPVSPISSSCIVTEEPCGFHHPALMVNSSLTANPRPCKACRRGSANTVRLAAIRISPGTHK